MERSPELQELIADWFEAFSRGDGTWLHRHVSPEADVRLIGTDPNECLEGQRVGGFLKSAAEAIGGDVEISPGEPVAVREGNVGWAITRPTFTLPDGREITPRRSAVFRREDGEWKAVQIHASVGIPNEELLGMDFPG
jgi:hypothetical protein